MKQSFVNVAIIKVIIRMVNLLIKMTLIHKFLQKKQI